jgi:hypothetical protein
MSHTSVEQLSPLAAPVISEIVDIEQSDVFER